MFARLHLRLYHQVNQVYSGVFLLQSSLAFRVGCLTKRSKELNQANLQEKLVGKLTKIRRHACPQRDANELDTFLWQTRSLKGYSFLNGVACCATNGWIILIGDHGAAREGIKPVSIALYGLYVCHLLYTPIAPVFLSGKRTFAFS